MPGVTARAYAAPEAPGDNLAAGFIDSNDEVIMSVRRAAARLATVGALLAGLVVLGSTPAAAADDVVHLRLPKDFTAGGGAKSVSMSVTKRTDGCVSFRTALAIQLPGLSPDQVRVRVELGGKWRALAVSAVRDGLVITERTAPDHPRLCKGKSRTVRYQLTFLAAAPGGRTTIVAEAYTAGGGLIDRAAGTRAVKGGARAPSSATPSPSASRSPSAAPTASDVIAGQPSADTSAPAAVRPAADESSGLFGIGTLVMVLGVVMVGLGVVLLIVLLRRGGTDRGVPGANTPPDANTPPGAPPPPAPGTPPPPAPGTPPPPASWAQPPPTVWAQPPPASGHGGDTDATMVLPKLPY